MNLKQVRHKQLDKVSSQTQPEVGDIHSSGAPSHRNRRAFLGRVGGFAAATMAAGLTGFSPLSGTKSAQVEAAEIGPFNDQQRRNHAYQIRHQAAIYQRILPLPDHHPTNGDEELYPNQIASYSKALPHNQLGEVDLTAYDAMIRALTTGNPGDFENIPLGLGRKLTNPQAALAFELEGPDSHYLTMIPPPTFRSAWEAAEIAEVFWQALTRDVNFLDYDTNAMTNARPLISPDCLISAGRKRRITSPQRPCSAVTLSATWPAPTSLSSYGKRFPSAHRPSVSRCGLCCLGMITWSPMMTGSRSSAGPSVG